MGDLSIAGFMFLGLVIIFLAVVQIRINKRHKLLIDTEMVGLANAMKTIDNLQQLHDENAGKLKKLGQ